MGLGSASEAGLATTQDQPTEARYPGAMRIVWSMYVPFLQACRGKNEEFKLCNINRCIKGTGSISIYVKIYVSFEVEMFEQSSVRTNSTWPPPGEQGE